MQLLLSNITKHLTYDTIGLYNATIPYYGVLKIILKKLKYYVFFNFISQNIITLIILHILPIQL